MITVEDKADVAAFVGFDSISLHSAALTNDSPKQKSSTSTQSFPSHKVVPMPSLSPVRHFLF